MQRKILATALFALFAFFSVIPAHAQSFSLTILPSGCGTANYQSSLSYLTIDSTGKLCTAASVSASITGFQPATTGTPISVTTGGVTGSLPSGAVVVASNVGATNGAYCKLGASATTSDQLIPPNSWFAFTVGAATQLTCITSTSTTTVNMVGGSGLPTGAGGGGGGGGSSGAVFGPTANGSAAANPPVLMGGTANGTATGNVGNWKVDSSGTGYIDAVAAGNLLSAVNSGVITNGSAPPATSIAQGGNGSGATGGLGRLNIICDQHAFFDSTTQLTTVVAGVSGRKIYVCGFILATGGTATNISLTSGTGTNCVTTSVAITPAYQLVANDKIGANSPFWNGLITLTAADNLCQSASAANAHQVEVWYAIL